MPDDAGGVVAPAPVWRVSLATLLEVLRHCLRDAPVEACGVISDGDPALVVPMTNVERSTTRYRFDPQQQLDVWQYLEDTGRTPVAVYHSHTDSPPDPSPTDERYAVDDSLVYLIVATVPVATTAHRRRDGRLEPLTIQLTG